ncbi:hypothetical protein BGZ73_003076 [Actinomortierella ambigua]|nr:hypothetical protein BGZ73_003076 [Actinomortierella ambigua]
MGKLLKLVNTIAVITVASIVAVSVYTHGPQDRAYFAPNESYITPMSYVFYMWIPVVLLLALMAAYQWTTDKLETTVGYHFTMATIFYAMWFAFSITDHPILALFGVAFASGAMSFIYNRLKTDETLDELKDVFCVLLPFSVCHGWFPVLFFLNLHAVISPVSEEGPSVIQPYRWACIHSYAIATGTELVTVTRLTRLLLCWAHPLHDDNPQPAQEYSREENISI